MPPFATRAAHHHIPPAAHSTPTTDHDVTAPRKMRKRKADSQENERLNKRLSLLNLGTSSALTSLVPIHEQPTHKYIEQNGQKLYVPVESPRLKPTAASSSKQFPENDHMQLDESKHKVYIYDLDAELSDGESSSDEGKLVFLPDIAKHLRQQSRIPPRVLANNDGELAGMQLVLYSEPKSLTVPEAQDSVRKAIVEARARLRNKQSGGADADADTETASSSSHMDIEELPERRVPNALSNLANDKIQPPATPLTNGNGLPPTLCDPDAMDID